MTNYIDYHQHLEKRLVQLGQELPGPMSGFARLHKKAWKRARSTPNQRTDGPGYRYCRALRRLYAYHVHDAVAAGATRAELLETIGVALMRAAGRPPSTRRIRWMLSNNFWLNPLQSSNHQGRILCQTIILIPALKKSDDGKIESRFILSLALTGLILAAEIIGGLWTGSLALLADAATFSWICWPWA